MDNSELDLYKILGVSKKASKEEIKKQFKQLTKKYHPDVNPYEDTTEMFKKILFAYDILSKEEKRKEYDNNQLDYDNINNTSKTEEDIKTKIKIYKYQVKVYKHEAAKYAFKGFLWFLGGMLLTWFSRSSAEETGGTYFVFSGAIIFGIIQAIKGLYAYIKITIEVRKLEEEFWKNIV